MRSALMMLCAVLATAPARGQTAPPSIISTGQAEASVQPDRATVSVAVETRATTAAVASADNARRVKSTLDTLRAIGLGKDQLGTSGYTVEPTYTPPRAGDEAKISGYTARNTIRVEIKRMDDVGRVIDAALASGANRIGSLEFTATNADSARREALARATAQARGDAEIIARAAGGSLGPLVQLSATGGGGIRPMYARMAPMAFAGAQTPIDAGAITVNASVTGQWQFQPGSH